MDDRFPWKNKDSVHSKVQKLFPWQSVEKQQEGLENIETVRGISIELISRKGEAYDIRNEIVRFSYPTLNKGLTIWTNDGAYTYGIVNSIDEYFEGNKEFWKIETNLVSIKFRILNKPLGL